MAAGGHDSHIPPIPAEPFSLPMPYTVKNKTRKLQTDIVTNSLPAKRKKERSRWYFPDIKKLGKQVINNENSFLQLGKSFHSLLPVPFSVK